jgi:hypothetical protein
MKILVLFTDMIRANRLSLFNDNFCQETPLDQSLKKIGGTAYTNCFTQGPDTPRGISSVLTGKSPFHNGCDVRLKWPRFFLDPSLKTIFDLFKENDFKIDILSDPRERAIGIFPEEIASFYEDNNKYDIDKFFKNLIIEDDHFIFLCLPQFHWTLDAYGASLNGEKNAHLDISYTIDKVFDYIDKDTFEHIFIFSDHGFKFTHEIRTEPRHLLLNSDRTNTIMVHREKFQNNIDYSNKLCSIADLYPTFQEILGITTNSNSISLFSKTEHEYVVIEDHINFMPSVNQNIELWALVNKYHTYIRQLDSGYVINRNTNTIKSSIIDEYDQILERESSYGKYKNEYEKVFVYSKNLVLTIGTNFDSLYDFRRNKRSAAISYFFKIKDITANFIRKLFL